MTKERRSGKLGHAIARLAEAQHGIVTREQLRALGLRESSLDRRIASGYLQPVFRGTFAVGHRAISRRGRLHAGVLACDEGTVLSHSSAAELLELWDRALPVVHVIPPDWSGRKIPQIRWHRVRQPLPDEIEVVDGIRCTNICRTIVDMAGESDWGRLRGLVEQAAILRKLDVDEIDVILSRGRRRGAPRLRSILTGWRKTAGHRPRLRSRLEARLFPLLAEEGLPVPRTNVRLRLEGETFEIDLLWERERLAVEADGEETHGTAAAFQRDRRRDQILLAAGYRTARITWEQVRDEPNAVLRRLLRMLRPN